MISVLALALPVLLAVVISFVLGIVMIIGAQKMMRLESYGWAMTASILAVLPFSPVGVLGLVFGIWSLVVLSRPKVKEAFETQRASPIPAEPSGTISRATQLARARIMLVFALLLIPFLLLAFWLNTDSLVGINNQGTLQIQTESDVKNVQILVQQGGQQVTLIDTQRRPWAVLHAGLYQLVLVSGSSATAGQIELSPSSVTISGGSRQTVRVYVRKDDTSKAKSDEESAADRAGWTLSPAGPVLSTNAKDWLKLKPDQVLEVNKILQSSYQEFLPLEKQNTERRTDEAGHVHITIKPFPASLAKLEDQLWLKLDSVFNAEQQSVARLNVKLNPAEVLQPGMTLRDAVSPGFFGWGKEGARLELWKVGTWSHWKVSARSNEYSGSAPKLPEEYRRFWKEPEAAPGTAEKTSD